MSRARSILHGATTPLALLALAAPLAVTALLAVARLLPWDEVLRARSVRLWAAAALLALAGAVTRAIAARRWTAAFAGAALALGGLQAAAAWALGVDATVDLGVGEQAVVPARSASGASAGGVQVEVLDLPVRRDGAARLRVAGREVACRVGGDLKLAGGGVLSVEDAFMAPSFDVRRASGAEEDSGYLKLAPGKREYFEAAVLPHRFYLQLPPPRGVEVALPPRVPLLVQRGKLRVLEREVALGEVVELEGLTLKLDVGAPWARIRVRRGAPAWPAVLAAGLAVAMVLSAVAERRRRA